MKLRRLIPGLLIAAVGLSSAAFAQIGPSYPCNNAQTNWGCSLWVEVCNRGTLDVYAVVGIDPGRGSLVARGFYELKTGQCKMVSQHDKFNLAFYTFVDERAALVQLDANKQEITYYQSAGLINAALGERSLQGMGGNATGRTCIRADFSAFEVDLNSWDATDPCPRGYVGLPLSNYFLPEINNPDSLTGTVNYYLYIYPTMRHVVPSGAAVAKRKSDEGTTPQERSAQTKARKPQGFFDGLDLASIAIFFAFQSLGYFLASRIALFIGRRLPWIGRLLKERPFARNWVHLGGFVGAWWLFEPHSPETWRLVWVPVGLVLIIDLFLSFRARRKLNAVEPSRESRSADSPASDGSSESERG
jgi:hypothetical protein